MRQGHRFDELEMVLTALGQQRASERNIGFEQTKDMVETALQQETGPGHVWFFKHCPERDDNLLFVAAVIDHVPVPWPGRSRCPGWNRCPARCGARGQK